MPGTVFERIFLTIARFFITSRPAWLAHCARLFEFPDNWMTFADLGLSDELLRAVSEAGYETPTPIQAQ
ncbi:MAG: hypothetical protein AB7D33_12100, partial [Sphingobium sp.]